MFFDSRAQACRLIDMQWTGTGHALSDVAYLLTTSLPQDLLPDTEEFLLMYQKLLRHEAFSGDGGDSKGTTHHAPIGEQRGRCLALYNVLWLDYARAVLLGLWKGFSEAKLEANSRNPSPGASYVTRSYPHFVFILSRALRVLVSLGWHAPAQPSY